MADQDLVIAARGGDQSAFAYLVAPRFGRLNAVARFIVPDVHGADDGLQDTVIAAWRDLPALRDPERFDAWLTRLLIRACRDRSRRRSKTGTVREIQVAPYRSADPADAGGSLALSQELERALQRLSFDQRSLIVLTSYLGLPIGDVADAMGVPVATAASGLDRARSVLEIQPDDALRDRLSARAETRVREGRLAEVLAAATARRQPAPWRIAVARMWTGRGGARAVLLGPRRVAVIVGAGLALAVVLEAVVIPKPTKPATPASDVNGLIAYSVRGDILVADPSGQGAVTVVHSPGLMMWNPIWSPDGRSLAFVEQGTSTWHVVDIQTRAIRLIGSYDRVVWSPDSSTLAGSSYDRVDLIRADTGERHRLVEPNSQSPLTVWTWSPDGRWLAGTRGRDLVLVDARTGVTRQLLAAIGEGRSFDQVAWSPDSSRLAYAEADCPSGFRRCTRAVEVIGVDGSDRRILTDYVEQYDLRPTWSPDGTWIAYAQPTGLSIVHPDGTAAQVLRATSPWVWAWSPDGTSLLFGRSVDLGNPGPIGQIDIATGEVRDLGLSADAVSWQRLDPGAPTPTLPPIADGPEPALTPQPSPSAAPSGPPAEPSGSATGVGFEAGCQVLVYEFAKEAVRAIAHEPHCPPDRSASAAWASDGSAIALAFDGNLAVITRSGNVRFSETIVSERPAPDIYVSWSPHGTYLLEQSNTENSSTFTILRPDGTGRVRVGDYPTWSPDDSHVAVHTAFGQLLVGAGDGSDLRAIGDYPVPATWSPDGQEFAYLHDGQVWIAGADGAHARAVTDFPLGGASFAAWSPDGRWIAAFRGTQVWLVSPSGTVRRPLALPEWSYWGVVWSPDGAHLALNGQPAQTDAPGPPPMFLVSVADGAAVAVPTLDQVVWSPDARYLAGYDSYQTTACIDIAVVKADGSGGRSLWSGECGDAQSLAWLP